MKKFIKISLWSVLTVIVVFGVFWLSYLYVTDYKKTICDTSVSPDGKYQLILEAVGEPDWPFGAASGRVVLKNGKTKISKIEFELKNDGANINSSCWKVIWYQDYAEIILSGSEQSDEHLVLYFNGKQRTDL